MISMPGGWEWIIIGIIVFIIFGKKLPNTMKIMGKTFANFRHGLKGVEEEVKDVKQIKNDIDIITKLKIG
ncbi:MAG: twin-arginine translocase TatA/TatE family subunit [Candidatus Brocadia sp. AMX2]|uniref:Sec-independent protein secretion pathway components n=1 Tax=Candidatus Brocadia sinica JPN1 TaxID=1197129 RepID=A0ABQ0K141_9BACT|nr:MULTISPECIES: twin-arginine translocase TatA/TatE family subunit [Brocadia]KXK30849.1 MAG: hypothetical protein UZ01_01208 [Candidatus Brocadia sinica]MBC6933440.1 twin-arginine translocase TatA/TatE family subunit [Candidatus Brocadia sp.]MBL1168011.1 twin-arginine translocase TatA/TatE family subunit [Candidatus Brocadia sp. AMX1]NOG42590.1 twin-arginine translocase TatA/TatE family subunit [Planctomycetota bacterium]KAA0243042.1 MAG: twin-arginine translocase TatA/TatE family subunit [Ca